MNIVRRFSVLRQLCFLFFCCFLLFPCFFLQGCSAFKLARSLTPEVQELRKGEKLFLEGKYSPAKKIFTTYYSDNSIGSQARQLALYDLLCTYIVQHPGSSKISHMIPLLEKWHPARQTEVYMENPDLMIIALKTHSLTLQEERKKENIRRLAEKDKLLEKQDHIDDLSEIIYTLEKQLETLESIDIESHQTRRPQ